MKTCTFDSMTMGVVTEDLRRAQAVQVVQLPRTIPKAVKKHSKLPMLKFATVQISRYGDTWCDHLEACDQSATLLFERLGQEVNRGCDYTNVNEAETKDLA